MATAFAFALLAMLAPTDAAQKATLVPCAGGRYVITGNPRSTGKPTLKSGSITLRNATIALSAGCPATTAHLKRMRHGMGAMKGGTRVIAKWAQCSGIRGKVRLKAGIDGTCKRMWGSISTRRGKSRFDAELSLCGNGVVDSGEQCDGTACTNGAACTDSCECDPNGVGPGCTPGVDGCPGHEGGPTTTTTVVPGGGGVVTTTSLGGGGSSTTTTTVGGGGGTTTTTLPGDHFKCYKIRENGLRFQPGPVSLVDQFGATSSVAGGPERLCNPVAKNGEAIHDPTAHLMCYDLQTEKGFVSRDVVVRNQFGDQILTVVRADSLCAPAEKDRVESPLNLNHFKCYRVAQRHAKFVPRTVSLADQFETKSTVVQKPLLLCNPVSKNGEAVVDPAGHLTCYRIVDAVGQPDFIQRQVSIEDQFMEQLVSTFSGTCRKSSLLCVPSLKDPSAASTTTTVPPTTTTSTSSTTSTSIRATTTTSTTSTTSTSQPGGSSTTSTSSTSSTSAPVGSTTSTSSTTPSTAPGSTSTSTSSTSSTTGQTPTTSTSSTSATTAPTPTTSSSTTSTSSTTTSTAGAPACCNNATHVSFLTANAPGDCGDIRNAAGALVTNIACAGLYTGGGGNSVPLPFAVPDQGFAINSITSCAGQTATLGSTTSTDTGSNRNCTSVGCLFGAPLAVPNPGSTPTSVCVLNALAQPPAGNLDCSTGATTLSLPLTSVIFLTGDTSTDPSSTIAGIQPCPVCRGGNPGTCTGGPNNGMACTPGTSDLDNNAAYPTSHDCPPDPMFSIGSLPIAFTLSTGTVSWSGTTATNDTGSSVSVQSRVFSGFCRDTVGTGAFQDPFKQCWENGMAVGTPCAEPFESCEQRNNGAFGPSGGNNRTITAIGSAGSLLGGSGSAKLVSVFSIPPTFNATVDAAGDLPGPGAVALPGTATLCTNAMCTP